MSFQRPTPRDVVVTLPFKGGIGTASRTLTAQDGGCTVGVLVQCNFGVRRDLRIAGVPVGEEITDLTPCIANNGPVPADSRARRTCDAPPDDAASRADATDVEQGSIIVVVAISPLFRVTAQATEAAITNALLAAETTTGANDLLISPCP